MKQIDKESKRKEYRIHKGDKIVIFDIHHKFLGIGKFIGSKRTKIFGIRMSIPAFKLKNKIIRGFECWWLPQKELESGELRKLITSGKKQK